MQNQDPKHFLKSFTVIFNLVIFVALSFTQVIDILTGANVLNPLVGVFVKDPEGASHVVTVIGQFYSLINLWLRFRTTQPVTLRKP